MTNLNRIILAGKVAEVPQLKYTTENVPFARFTLTVDRPTWTQGGEKVSDSFPIIAWRRLAEIAAEYLAVNELVIVEGRIQERSFNAEDGRRNWVVEIIANDLRILGGRKGKTNRTSGRPEAATAGAASEEQETPAGLDNFSMPYFPLPEEEEPTPEEK